MNLKAALSIGSMIASSIVISLVPARQAQAVTLATLNGNFVGATVNGGATDPNYINGPVTTSAYLGDPNVALPGWSFPTNSQTPSNGQPGFNFVVAFGTQIYGNGNQLATQDRCAVPTGCGNAAGLVSGGATSLLNPVTGTASGFFIAADAFYNRGAINTDITGLTVGNIYTVSFYQATGQQQYQTASNFSDWFSVTFGGTTQQSATMNYTAGSSITPWTLQSLDFTATSANQTLSFLADSPNNVPPFALLSNVTVVRKSTLLPEPETYLGTLMCGGFLVAVIRSGATKKKLDE